MTRLPLQSSYYQSVDDMNRARKLIRRIRRQRMLETPFVITERIDRDVEIALGGLGYNQFSWFSRDGRLYMEVSTSLEGQEPPSLPTWLQIPYIIPTRGHVLRIIPDSNSTNRKVLPGQALKDTEGRPLSSLGPILASERRGRGSLTPVHGALTAGHVIPDMATEMMVDDPSD